MMYRGNLPGIVTSSHADIVDMSLRPRRDVGFCGGVGNILQIYWADELHGELFAPPTYQQ